ncbi:MAG TPA: ABC transporter ATP-binding protein [Candidatus Ozemobacteraceae bacterium]|nr:ABC transporter ATP-binding protein [Candidatus Ozemobacteraceae bacterium]
MTREVVWLWGFWRPYWRRMTWIVILTALKTALFLSYPIFFKWIVDGIRGGLTPEGLRNYVLGLILTGVGSSAVYILLQANRAMMNFRMEQMMRDRVFGKVLEKDLTCFRTYPTGDVVTRLLDDLSDEKLCWFACSGIFRCLEAVFVLSFMVLILVNMNYKLTLVTFLPLALITLVFLAVERKLHRLYHALQESVSKVNTFLETCFSGIRVVKAYGSEPWQKQAFGVTVDDRAEAEVTLAKLDAGIHQTYGLMNSVGILLVLWLGGRMVVNGTLSLGDFVAFSTYIHMVIEPMVSIGFFFTRGKQALVAIHRLLELEDAPVEVVTPVPSVPVGPFEELRLENVSFRYGPDLPLVLENVGFALRRGEVVGIAGEVGSGKSTLFQLLLRFTDPSVLATETGDRGRVLVNGIDVRQLDLAALRRLFAWVPQEALLFTDTVRANVAFERSFSDEQIAAVATQAEIAGEIEGFPQKYAQEVGQRGLTLSGGQKQRVALARALGHPADILLLDDLTAALDARTEEKLWANLLAPEQRRTLLMISHRWATLQRCDRVVVLDRGRVVEEGPPQTLLQRKGHLWQLVQRETLQEELQKNGNGSAH